MIHSFLLIGQSNMAGRGFLNEAVEVNSSRIYVLRNGRWQEMYRPVNGDRAFSGVCLAERFAELYSEKYNVDVGLIPCADGGTGLWQWQPGSLLYDNAVYQTRLALRTSNLAGVLWHQGESECEIERATTYIEKFMPIYNSLYKDLELSDVPFIVGGIGDYLENCPFGDHFKNYNVVNNQLKELADKNPLIGYASAEGLESNPDILHFNARSLYEFGGRYFDEFEKLRNPDKVFTEKPDVNSASRGELEKL